MLWPITKGVDYLPPLKIMTVFGTRPDAIKMAPVVRELTRYPGDIKPVVAVTAQHREMLDQVLELFHIVPDYDLDIMQARQSLFDITCRVLQGLGKVLTAEKPDLVLVHGDTTTTFTGALAAFYCQTAVGHVEAGLRTGEKYSPYPEEMNRRLTGALVDLHFAPTATAQRNLRAEGVPPARVLVTGNTVIDALRATVQPDYRFAEAVLNDIDYRRRVLLVTTHRRENLGEPLRHVYIALRQIVQEFPDVTVVFPVHRNPRVRQVVAQELGQVPRVHLIDPLEYEPFVNLMARCYLVLTDSGGIQEEAPSLGKPVLVLRDTTERPEAVAAGTVQLVGTARDAVYAETRRLLTDAAAYRRMATAVNPYGDGQAAPRIVAGVLHHFGRRREAPAPFVAPAAAAT